jgi:hypothetical protein
MRRLSFFAFVISYDIKRLQSSIAILRRSPAAEVGTEHDHIHPTRIRWRLGGPVNVVNGRVGPVPSGVNATTRRSHR